MKDVRIVAREPKRDVLTRRCLVCVGSSGTRGHSNRDRSWWIALASQSLVTLARSLCIHPAEKKETVSVGEISGVRNVSAETARTVTLATIRSHGTGYCWLTPCFSLLRWFSVGPRVSRSAVSTLPIRFITIALSVWPLIPGSACSLRWSCVLNWCDEQSWTPFCTVLLRGSYLRKKCGKEEESFGNVANGALLPHISSVFGRERTPLSFDGWKPNLRICSIPRNCCLRCCVNGSEWRERSVNSGRNFVWLYV